MLNFTNRKIFSCWSRKDDVRYGISKPCYEITKPQNHVISKEKKSHVFYWKRSVGVLECGRLQINLAVKTTWRESLACSTIILWYISSLECQRFMSCNATLEGPRGKSNRFVSSSYATEREKMASSWEKSREIWSNNYSRGPNRIVRSSWPTTL